MRYECFLRDQLIEYLIIVEEYGHLIRLRLIHNEGIIEWHEVALVVWVLRVPLRAAVRSNEHPHAHCILPPYVLWGPPHINAHCRYFLGKGKFMEELGFIKRWTDVVRTIVTAIGILNCCSILADYINFVQAIVVLEERPLCKSIIG
jgi:hypothetical protein